MIYLPRLLLNKFCFANELIRSDDLVKLAFPIFKLFAKMNELCSWILIKDKSVLDWIQASKGCHALCNKHKLLYVSLFFCWVLWPCLLFSWLTWCRVDVAVFVIWELVILAFLVFSAVSLYFRHLRLAFILVCVTLLLLFCMKITKQVRLARKKKRRMLLPLSM